MRQNFHHQTAQKGGKERDDDDEEDEKRGGKIGRGKKKFKRSEIDGRLRREIKGMNMEYV